MQPQQHVPPARPRSFLESLARVVVALGVVAVLVVGALFGLGVFAVREGLSTVAKTVEIAERIDAMMQRSAAHDAGLATRREPPRNHPVPAGETSLRGQADRMAGVLAALATPDPQAAACVDKISYRDGEVVVSLSLPAEFQGKAPRFEIKSPETNVLPFDATTDGNQHHLKLGDPGPLTMALKVWIGDAYAGRFVALKGRDMDLRARRAK